jgi:tetratricopeptide (TPR) repeat protein
MIARSHSTVIDYQPSIHAEKARSLSSARQYAQAIEEVTKAIELQPMCPVLYQNRGVIRQEANDDVGAIADLTKALDLDDECDDAIHARAYSRFRRGDKDGAVKDYTELIKRRGDMPQPYFLRAWVLSEAKEYAKAVADYSATIERDVEYAPAYRGRWAAYRALGNETAAQADAAMYEKLRGR